MGDYFFHKIIDRWTGTGVGTNAGVTVTKAAAQGKRYSVTGVQCSGDAAAVVTVESPAGTVVFRKRFAAAFVMSETFAPGTKLGLHNTDVLVKISASTTNCEANIDGVSITGA